MKEYPFDDVQVGFAVRSPSNGKIYHVSNNFDSAVHLSGLLKNENKLTEIVIVPLTIKS